MNTKIVMVASSLFLGLVGGAASFAPAEILTALNAPTVNPLPLLIQLLGSLYLAFAMTNWTAKDSMIGGIYARPLSLGNCLHFVVGTLSLLKDRLAHGFQGPLVIVLVGYMIFALCFAYLVFGLGTACKVNPSPFQPDK